MIRPFILAATAAAMSAIVVPELVPVTPKLIWNSSGSVPIGLYGIVPVGRIDVTDLVVVTPPEPLATYLHERSYLPHGLPLLKRVVALPGREVCRHGQTVSILGVVINEALIRDRRGRVLPVWNGCRRIRDGELFVMNWQSRDSFDSRYFGPVPLRSVIGKAVPLFTDEASDGRFVWRAATR